jgi:hypothetical protein
MHIDVKRTITNGVTDPDPIANPELVVGALVTHIKTRQVSADILAERMMFALDAPVAETLTVSVYALDQAKEPGANAVWYIVATGETVTGRTLSFVDVPPTNSQSFKAGSAIYVRVTTNNLTVPRVLGLAAVQ